MVLKDTCSRPEAVQEKIPYARKATQIGHHLFADVTGSTALAESMDFRGCSPADEPLL